MPDSVGGWLGVIGGALGALRGAGGGPRDLNLGNAVGRVLADAQLPGGPLYVAPPNPQVGVEELPPPSSNDPAPLPNPGGDYTGPFPENDIPDPVTGYAPDDPRDPIYGGALPPYIPYGKQLTKKPPGNLDPYGSRIERGAVRSVKLPAGMVARAAAKRLGALVLGRILPVGSLAIPSELGSGELPPEMRPKPVLRTSTGKVATVERSRIPTTSAPRALVKGQQLEEVLVGAKRLPVPRQAPRSQATPARSTTPAQVLGAARVTPSASRKLFTLKQPGYLGLLAPVVFDALQRRRAPKNGVSSTLPSSGTSPGETVSVPSPLTPTESTVLPSPGSYPFPSFGGSGAYLGSPQQRCECAKRKRAAKRTCRAKAAVRWAGGPKKGQLAGKRCISWES